MKRKFIFSLVLLLVTIAVIGWTVITASAQSGGIYDLTWNSIDGGGVTSSIGGAYSLGGTIGQPDAGTLSGGTYTLNGGFWVDTFGNRLNLPLIVK